MIRLPAILLASCFLVGLADGPAPHAGKLEPNEFTLLDVKYSLLILQALQNANLKKKTEKVPSRKDRFVRLCLRDLVELGHQLPVLKQRVEGTLENRTATLTCHI